MTEKRRIVATRELPALAMARLARDWSAWVNLEPRAMTQDEILARVRAADADALMVMATDRVDATFIAALPARLRVLATLSLGHEHVALDAAKARGLPVLNALDVLSESVADMALLLMLGAARRAHEASRLLYSGNWQGWTPTQLMGREVHGARLGILGMGRIGRAIAKRAGRGFGMAVHYHNRTRLPADLEDGATHRPSAEALFAESDFLVLAAPSTPATRGIVNASTIARLPDRAVVINVARGDLVDDEALIAALKAGRIAAAGLDVFKGEPKLNPGYLALDNVFLQPHQGSSTLETRGAMVGTLIDSIEAFLDGKQVSNRLV